MPLKKQLSIFFAAIIAFAALYAAICALVDPFGIFGDVLFDYYEYDMTENPRIAKIAYIDRHHDEYDSYLLGCSKTSSYPVDELNEYLGARFYNMFTYGSDLADTEKTARYIIGNYEVKNLVLEISPEGAYSYDTEEDPYKNNLHAKVDERVNPVLFYAKYLFLNPAYLRDKIASYLNRSYLPDATNVFIVETGAYNKILRDTMPVSDIDAYLDLMQGAEFDMDYRRPMKYTDEAVSSVRAIKEMCDEAGINFIMIGSPLYDAEMRCYNKDEMLDFCKKLTEICDFDVFWGYNAFSHDARYFYDAYHFRNCVGSAVLSSVFGSDGYVPSDFGIRLTRENAEESVELMYDTGRGASDEISKKVPILMYHALTDDEEKASDTTVTSAKFEEQISALSDAGFTSITYSELREYVMQGRALPEKPIIITFDDGYESNITLASPILEKYGMCGCVAVIGVSVGKDTYKDTDTPITPHFSFDMAKEAYDAGVFDFQSHTYDMHNSEVLDAANYRDGMLKKAGESEDEYISALRHDFERSRAELEGSIGNEVFVITYPYGKYSELTDAVMAECGASVSVTVDAHMNEIVKGLPQSMRGLGRFNMDDSVSGNDLVRSLTEKIYD